MATMSRLAVIMADSRLRTKRMPPRTITPSPTAVGHSGPSFFSAVGAAGWSCAMLAPVY
jgi:hypothetical protein